MKNKNIFRKLGGEFLFGILETVGTNFESKIGFGIFLIIAGGAFLFGPKTQGTDLTIQYVVGSILIVFALFLFIWRIEELNNEKKSKQINIMKIRNLLAISIGLVWTSNAYSQETKAEVTTAVAPVEIIERLNIPGPLTFNENEFLLALSKQNSATWAQQQYIMRDDVLSNYRELINISYFDKEIDMETAIKQKVEFVEQRRSKDKYSFVNVTESPDGKEIIVDYLTTETPAEGEPYAEYNLDRFKNYDIGGKKSFVIFSYSKRIAGDLKYAARSLSKERSRLMEAAIKTAIPPVTYKPTAVEKKKK